jgi:hypothetical protein
LFATPNKRETKSPEQMFGAFLSFFATLHAPETAAKRLLRCGNKRERARPHHLASKIKKPSTAQIWLARQAEDDRLWTGYNLLVSWNVAYSVNFEPLTRGLIASLDAKNAFAAP